MYPCGHHRTQGLHLSTHGNPQLISNLCSSGEGECGSLGAPFPLRDLLFIKPRSHTRYAGIVVPDAKHEDLMSVVPEDARREFVSGARRQTQRWIRVDDGEARPYRAPDPLRAGAGRLPSNRAPAPGHAGPEPPSPPWHGGTIPIQLVAMLFESDVPAVPSLPLSAVTSFEEQVPLSYSFIEGHGRRDGGGARDRRPSRGQGRRVVLLAEIVPWWT